MPLLPPGLIESSIPGALLSLQALQRCKLRRCNVAIYTWRPVLSTEWRPSGSGVRPDRAVSRDTLGLLAAVILGFQSTACGGPAGQPDQLRNPVIASDFPD